MTPKAHPSHEAIVVLQFRFGRGGAIAAAPHFSFADVAGRTALVLPPLKLHEATPVTFVGSAFRVRPGQLRQALLLAKLQPPPGALRGLGMMGLRFRGRAAP
jgi:hypothetical protein